MSNWTHPASQQVIIQHKTTGEELTFPSLNQAAKHLEASQANLSTAKNNPRRTVKGYRIITV